MSTVSWAVRSIRWTTSAAVVAASRRFAALGKLSVSGMGKTFVAAVVTLVG